MGVYKQASIERMFRSFTRLHDKNPGNLSRPLRIGLARSVQRLDLRLTTSTRSGSLRLILFEKHRGNEIESRLKSQGRVRQTADANARSHVPLAQLHKASAAGVLGMPSSLVQVARESTEQDLGYVPTGPRDRHETVA